MFDTSRIHPMLDKVQSYLGQWLEDHLKQIRPADWWERCVLDVLVPEQRENVINDGAKNPSELDLSTQISVFRGNWLSLRRKFHLDRQLYDDAISVKCIRNKYSHKKSSEDYESRFDHNLETVRLFLKGLGASIPENKESELKKDNTMDNLMTFDSIIEAARTALPDNIRRAPWIGLEHGVVLLDTEQKLDQYLAAYGKMHAEKIRMALDSLDDSEALLAAPVSVIDWGCGQGLAICCLLDWMRNNEINLSRIDRIHLIEPSAPALKRAELNVAQYERQYNCQFAARTTNKFINAIQPADFNIRGINTTIHMFSNVLDIETIDLDFLVKFIQNTFVGRQIFCCVGPLNNGESRIMDFARKFGITQGQIESRFKGKLTHSKGTISMLTFVIDEGISSVREVVIEPMPQNVNGNITLQRLFERYKPSQDILDRILQFYLMSTELEQLKEPDVYKSTPFVMTEAGVGLQVSFKNNCDGMTPFAAACREFALKCKMNADQQQTKWPKDLHFALEVAWNGSAYRLLYATRSVSELGQLDYQLGEISLQLNEFLVDLVLAEKLGLSDDDILEIEHCLHSADVSLVLLNNQMKGIIDKAAQLNTTQIYLSLCQKQIALVQTYSELKRMDVSSVDRNPLLKAFLENAEFDNAIDFVSSDELISAVPMDKYQSNAIAHALNNRVSVVVGSPGCGKTQLLLNLLANALVRGKKVLVASKNNKAVDNVVERFGQFDGNGCFLRFGTKKYLQDTTCHKIAGLLNFAQMQNYDDQPYQTEIHQFKQAIEGLRKKDDLKDVRARYNDELLMANQEISILETQLAEMQRQLDGILPDFCEKARVKLRDELQCREEEKKNLKDRIEALKKKYFIARNHESQILLIYISRARERLGKKLQEWQNRLLNANQRVANLEDEISDEVNKGRIEIEKINNIHINCASLKGIETRQLLELVVQLRRMSADIDCKVSDKLHGIWVRMFGKAKLAKEVLDFVANIDGLIRIYLNKIDCRSRINDFKSCNEIAEFCCYQADALDVVINYRESIARIRQENNSRVEELRQLLINEKEKVEVAKQRVNAQENILASEALLEDFTKREFGRDIETERQYAQRDMQRIDCSINEATLLFQQTIQLIGEISTILSNAERLSKYTQTTYRLPITDRTSQVNAQIMDTRSKIDSKKEVCNNVQNVINSIDKQLEEIDVLTNKVFSVEFGQQLVALTLNHYLHVNDSARAISAYNRYLPDNIPRKHSEVQSFILATKRFLDVCRLTSVTSLSVKNSFPMVENLFDLLVIDEASQCDVASALPLILRAKQIVIIGDPMQLRHISQINAEEELAIKRHLNLTGATHLKYSEESLWDYTRNWLPWCGNDSPCVLENHYRCHPDIIGYSNNMFYRTLAIGGLNVCTSTQTIP